MIHCIMFKFMMLSSILLHYILYYTYISSQSPTKPAPGNIATYPEKTRGLGSLGVLAFLSAAGARAPFRPGVFDLLLASDVPQIVRV